MSESRRSLSRLAVAASVAALSVGAFTACSSGSDTPSPPVTPSTPASTSSPSNAAPPAVTGASGTGQGTGGGGAGSPSPPPSSHATPTSDTWASGIVDAERFRTEMGYFFLTPDGQAFCAIQGDGAAGNLSVGCQGEMPPPVEIKDCVGGGTKSAAVWLGAGGVGQFTCFNQGVFVSSATSQGQNRLEPGQTIAARGYRCRADSQGVSCQPDAGGRGFSASGAGLSLY